jgi:YesN/AraC family two-component response regulator
VPSVVEPNAEIYNEEVIYQNPLLFLKIWEIHDASPKTDLPPGFWRWHYHKEVEFLAIVEGELGMQTKEEYFVLKPGDVYLLGSSQLHRTNKIHTGELTYIVFQVDLSQHFDQSTMPYLHCFSELRRPLSEVNYVFRESPAAQAEAYKHIMGILQEMQTKQRGYEMAISSAIRQLLLLLLRQDTRGLLQGTEEAELLRIRPALDYIEQHLAEKLTVEELCGVLNLSYHYFIKYFKKVMGLSFVDYVNYKRIKKAERLLLTKDLSIVEVGCEVGIPNMAQFYKMFKRFNQCSPKEFKQRMRGETGAGVPE